MKAKITKPDGTVVELEGEAAEVVQAIGLLNPAPVFPILPTQIAPLPLGPVGSLPIWYGGPLVTC